MLLAQPARTESRRLPVCVWTPWGRIPTAETFQVALPSVPASSVGPACAYAPVFDAWESVTAYASKARTGETAVCPEIFSTRSMK